MKIGENITCRIFNETAGLDLVLPNLVASTATELFAHEDYLETSSLRTRVDERYIKWILEEDDLSAAFKALAEYTGLTVERIIQLYFYIVLIEDPHANEVFIEKSFVSKKSFIEDFKNFNKDYIPSDCIQTVAPDILLYLLCYILMNKYQRDNFEIPQEVLPYILNISGVGPEDGYPEDFNPEAQYKNDVYDVNKKSTKDSFFERFRFLKKK